MFDEGILMRMVIVIVALAWAGSAAADLYRWVDPETGSVKFSSYPPPWYGEGATQRRGPIVHITPRRSAAASRPRKLLAVDTASLDPANRDVVIGMIHAAKVSGVTNCSAGPSGRAPTRRTSSGRESVSAGLGVWS